MISRRNLLLSSAAGPLAAQAASARPKNILLLIADDLGLHTGEYGDKTAITPNLDRMAREGVRFANAFCTTASCSASRSVILSGLQNHANGQYGHAHDGHNFSYLPQIRPTPDLLKDAGYASAVIAKLHVNPLERFRWDAVIPGGGRNGYEMARQARKFIQSAGGKPWYLHVGFTDPHRDFANRDYPGIKRTPFDSAKVAVPSFLPDNQPTREELAEYYEACNRLDQGVGHFFEVLKETGQLDNTLVIFMSDNGMPFPNAKTGAYDAGLHLPLIVRAPGQKNRGLVSKAMVSWVDIMPTIIDWAGAKLPDYPVHGRSLLPILEQEEPAGWDRVHFSHSFHELTMYYPMRGLRTKKFKYIRNLFPELEFPFSTDLWASKCWQNARKEGPSAKIGKRPVSQYLHRAPEELYDIVADPDEVNNLAGSPEHRQVLGDMRAEVQAYRKKTNDIWLVNDDYNNPPPAGAARPRRKKT